MYVVGVICDKRLNLNDNLIRINGNKFVRFSDNSHFKEIFLYISVDKVHLKYNSRSIKYATGITQSQSQIHGYLV